MNAWLESQAFELILSDAVLAEVDDVLARSRLAKWIVGADAHTLVHGIRIVAELVIDPLSPPTFTRDPDDDYLIALAREHHADVIVSGDKDLLTWNETAGRRHAGVVRADARHLTGYTRSRDTPEPRTLASAVTPDLHPTGHYTASSATSDGRGSISHQGKQNGAPPCEQA